MDRDVVDVLRRAKYLLARPGGWVQNTAVGERVLDTESGEKYYPLCATAAVEVADGVRTEDGISPAVSPPLSEVGRRAMSLLWLCMDHEHPVQHLLPWNAHDRAYYSVQYYNDSHSQDEVLDLFNRALARAVEIGEK